VEITTIEDAAYDLHLNWNHSLLLVLPFRNGMNGKAVKWWYVCCETCATRNVMPIGNYQIVKRQSWGRGSIVLLGAHRTNEEGLIDLSSD